MVFDSSTCLTAQHTIASVSPRMILCGLVLLVSGSVLVHATYNPALDTAWEDWKSTHQKGYFGLGEEDIRRTIWEKNMQLIEAHNQEYELGIHTYELGMNHLGDMTTEEVVATMTGFRPDMEEEINSTFVPDSKAAPSSIDYRAIGYVTPVKNQGSCGSCWAFSAAGALEGQLSKKEKDLVDLSPQNLVDCVGQDMGCNGGYMTYAFDYVRRNGIAAEKAYPYTGMDERCHYNSSMNRASCRSYRQIKKGDKKMLKLALSQIGPISVAVDASLESFHFYKNGIYNDWQCSHEHLNHAVLAVGYTTRYWIVKNSWGTEWGDKGYIYIKKGRNVCGIANMASYPVV
ncbi:cathepsin K-like [Clupea harengus]|uniref:Cystein proteinase inhibitor protein salarin n=1 Tax=Clupea harengus TaxID=7950 RepID=A0A6P3VK05_CLUHA|nr:cathepsin K-like [Clupea harengus]